MPNDTINTIKSVGSTFLFTGGGIALSLQDVESYLRIVSLLVGIGTTVYVFVKNHKKR